MRLSEKEAREIATAFHEVFRQGRVSLFGSRVDDAKKGGDIDLYMEVPDKADLFLKKISFLARLKQKIGDRKIDVVFDMDPSRLIEQEARKWAIPL